MLKRNKGTIILTACITALPMLLGLVLWSRLPETIATHFDAHGNPNGWSSKAFAVFGLRRESMQIILISIRSLTGGSLMNLPAIRKQSILKASMYIRIWVGN